jgi:hypothetical protein
MKATTSPRIPGLILIALALLLAGGCFQLETLVKIHEDGSAIITERFQLSRRLLEFDNSAAGSVLASELTKEAVLERMKLMGKGISLVSHEVRDGEGGGKESVSVFQMPDVSEFQYASPYVGLPGYSGQCMMKCQVAPRLKDGALMTVTFVPVVTDAAKAKVEAPKIDPKNPPKGPSPADLQVFRQLQPVVRDLLQGLHLKFTLESYAPAFAPWGWPGVRNSSANTHRYDLIDFSDKDLDAYGSAFLENEEIMLELERMQVDGPNVRQHLEGMFGNLTLPLFYLRPSTMFFKPSRYYFDKFFAGKTLAYGQWAAPDKLVPAKFEEIGWQPPPSIKP